MRDDRIRQWLEDCAESIVRFMDYNPHPTKAIADSLGGWLNNHHWNDDGRYVASLGFNSLGGEVVHWGRSAADAVVVYFGSEGGFGVLAPSLLEWVRAIARGSVILEHGPPAKLFVPETRRPAAAEALRGFRRAVERRFGLGTGPHDLTDLNAELVAWVTARQQMFSMQDLIRIGLQGGPGSGVLRARVCAELGFRKANAKALLKRLNASGIEHGAFDRAVAAARASVET